MSSIKCPVIGCKTLTPFHEYYYDFEIQITNTSVKGPLKELSVVFWFVIHYPVILTEVYTATNMKMISVFCQIEDDLNWFENEDNLNFS